MSLHSLRVEWVCEIRRSTNDCEWLTLWVMSDSEWVRWKAPAFSAFQACYARTFHHHTPPSLSGKEMIGELGGGREGGGVYKQGFIPNLTLMPTAKNEKGCLPACLPKSKVSSHWLTGGWIQIGPLNTLHPPDPQKLTPHRANTCHSLTHQWMRVSEWLPSEDWWKQIGTLITSDLSAFKNQRSITPYLRPYSVSLWKWTVKSE